MGWAVCVTRMVGMRIQRIYIKFWSEDLKIIDYSGDLGVAYMEDNIKVGCK
jgi:hypothetical protein